MSAAAEESKDVDMVDATKTTSIEVRRFPILLLDGTCTRNVVYGDTQTHIFLFRIPTYGCHPIKPIVVDICILYNCWEQRNNMNIYHRLLSATLVVVM